jgi:hypothetical protein
VKAAATQIAAISRQEDRHGGGEGACIRSARQWLVRTVR